MDLLKNILGSKELKTLKIMKEVLKIDLEEISNINPKEQDNKYVQQLSAEMIKPVKKVLN